MPARIGPDRPPPFIPIVQTPAHPPEPLLRSGIIIRPLVWSAPSLFPGFPDQSPLWARRRPEIGRGSPSQTDRFFPSPQNIRPVLIPNVKNDPGTLPRGPRHAIVWLIFRLRCAAGPESRHLPSLPLRRKTGSVPKRPARTLGRTQRCARQSVEE